MMKKGVRQADPQRQSHWEEVLRRWQATGQSVRDYCRAEGLRESAFYFWRRELARRGHGADAGDQTRPKARQTTSASQSPRRASWRRSAAPAFLPVDVVEHRAAEARGGVEIVLAEGRMLRVRAGFDRQTLIDVLAVLEARPC